MTADAPDYYDILGISPDATREALREAYRKLVLEWHPDRRPDDPEAATRFHQIQEAYEVLSVPDRRREYDVDRKSRSRATPESDVWEDSWDDEPAEGSSKAAETSIQNDEPVPQHGRPGFWEGPEVPQEGRPGFWNR